MKALEIAMSTNKKQIFKILLNSTNLNLDQSDMTWAGKTILINVSFLSLVSLISSKSFGNCVK